MVLVGSGTWGVRPLETETLCVGPMLGPWRPFFVAKGKVSKKGRQK